MIEYIGWLGVASGLLVAPPQLIKLLKTKRADGVSLLTYTFLLSALFFYLLHAIYIRDAVFITAQSVNLVVNGIILGILVRRKISGV